MVELRSQLASSTAPISPAFTSRAALFKNSATVRSRLNFGKIVEETCAPRPVWRSARGVFGKTVCVAPA